MHKCHQCFSTYWQLIAAGEPYRLLFAVGTLIGIAGVLMWPLYVWHFTETYPGHLHARVMIEGFLTAFVMGFLGTALPRLLGVPKLVLGETLALTVAVIGVTLLHLTGQTLEGDQLFVLLLLGFTASLGLRGLLFRQDVPPPAFVLVLIGMICAVFGAATQVVAHLSPSALPGWMPYFGRLLLYQGYLVFPIMGIGAFLLPRFFGMPSGQNFPESLSLPPGWIPKAAFALACGAVVMAGFVLEALGHPAWGNALRAVGIGVYFVREIPAHKLSVGGSLAFGLRLALLAIPLAYLLMAIWPQHRFAFIHILLITGFSLITFIVASRVVYGHSGQTEKFRAGIWAVRILVSGIFVAMLTRVTADWMPDSRMTHYAYAAIIWVAAVACWGFAVLPGVTQPDSDA
jgi:uncharacterized protein involved in response to NO